MNRSIEINEIATALCEFQSELQVLELNKSVKVKTKNGGEYSFKYATFSNGLNIIRPLLHKHKLSFSQIVEKDASVTTILMHTSGQFLEGNLHLKTNEENAQAIGSLITYTKRYSLFSMIGLIGEDDDDGNSASGNHIQQQTETTPKNWLNPKTQQWNEAIDYLKKGGTIDAIKKKYSISKANQELLISEAV